MTKSIALVHLVWGPLGTAPLERFLDSYRMHPAGADHEVVVLLNGVEREQLPAIEAALDQTEHRTLSIPAPVQDLLAYRRAAEQLSHDRVCFLNSHSVIAASDWLAKLSAALDDERTGLVGATGSWASVHSAVLNSLAIRTPYRGAFPSRGVAARELAAIDAELARESRPDAGSAHVPVEPTVLRRLRAGLGALRLMPEQLRRFGPFPAYHLRTNGFMTSRRRFASLSMPPIECKMDAYALESGRRSLTARVLDEGRRALVVDRDGTPYEHTGWPESRTLWQGDQEGLMIEDNQTRAYAGGGIERRSVLSAIAWGLSAAPTAPGDGV